MRFSVWAPRPERVELLVDGRLVPMERLASNWWITDAHASPGSRYGFSLDGHGPLPDPRSPSQPDGEFGLSEVLDHSSFVWHDGGFGGLELSEAILYECHVGTFTDRGDFDGVAERLAHLVELGVTCLELMPVCTFPGRRGWGYDGVLPFAPHAAYGGPEGLKRLVDACHAAGIAVVLDVVYNHVGPRGNHLPAYGPYFTNSHTTTWGEAMNFEGPAGSWSTTRAAGSATTTSTGCASTPSTRSSTAPRSTCSRSSRATCTSSPGGSAGRSRSSPRAT